MATYKNYPILQNADTIAAIPAYTTSLVDTLASMLGNADYQTHRATGGAAGNWEWDIEFVKIGKVVFTRPILMRRTSGSGTFTTLFTLPAAFRPISTVPGPVHQPYAGTAGLWQIFIEPDGSFRARNTAANPNTITWVVPPSWVVA